jgi:hypothetical protein
MATSRSIAAQQVLHDSQDRGQFSRGLGSHRRSNLAGKQSRLLSYKSTRFKFSYVTVIAGYFPTDGKGLTRNFDCFNSFGSSSPL